MHIEFFGATREVTGSCFLVEAAGSRVLIDCGMIQGSDSHVRHNRDPFFFKPDDIDAVVLTHAHIDHTGRTPLLIKQGFSGPVYTHKATVQLCAVMLEDAGFLHEKEAEWQNKKRLKKGLEPIEPLYTQEEARQAQSQFKGLEYTEPEQILPGIRLTLQDAGHILGSAIVELELEENNRKQKLVFNGDLGHYDAPILRDPEPVSQADLVIMESTYGDRLHRSWEETWEEMGEIITGAHSSKGNILIPAFTVGRTQELLYIFRQNFKKWNIADWDIYLDSPMGIKATKIYSRHSRIYDVKAKEIYEKGQNPFSLPNLHMSLSTEESMRINEIKSGAIIIAGSGMCTGGRIRHHLKYNVWRENSHVLFVGYQARGTLGRVLVDRAEEIYLWGDKHQVKARVHTIGGLSAHADQQGLMKWYSNFSNQPKVILVHGEADAMNTLAQKLKAEYGSQVIQAEFQQKLEL